VGAGGQARPRRGADDRLGEEVPMLWILASFLLLVWIVALALKVTIGAIHLLLIAALAIYVWGFIRTRTRGGTTV
jgi:Flp pilus assembly protein TadB